MFLLNVVVFSHSYETLNDKGIQVLLSKGCLPIPLEYSLAPKQNFIFRSTIFRLIQFVP